MTNFSFTSVYNYSFISISSNVSYEEWHRTKSNLIRALKNIIGMNCWILQKIEDLNKSDKLTSSSDNFSSFNCKFSNLLKNKCTFLKDIKMLLRSTMEVLCLNTLGKSKYSSIFYIIRSLGIFSRFNTLALMRK